MRTATRITQFRLRRHMLGIALLALAAGWALLFVRLDAVQAGEPAGARPGPPGATANAAITPTSTISLPMGAWPEVTVTGSGLPSWVRSLQEAGGVAQPTGPVSVFKTAPEEVSLGGRVEYGLVVSNTGDQQATVLVYDVLPIPIYEGEADCYPECIQEPEVMTMTITTPSRYGAPPSTLVVRVVYRLSWENIIVPPGEYREMEFSIPVSGKDDGMPLKNRAYIRYTLADGTEGTSMSNETETLVSVDVESTSGATLSKSPVWLSEDQGGSGSVDWGDFDRDGNLDLAVGGSQGTTIYRNLGGQLTRFWNTVTYSHDLHWIDVDGDDTLELVAIGYHWWTNAIDNHIYKRSPDGARFDEIGPTQLITAPLLQVTPADLDADGDLDLVALTAERWTIDDCAVRLYRNDGDLYNTPYTCLAAPKRDYAKTSEDFLALGDRDNDDDLDLVLDVWDLENPDPGAPCLYRDLLWLMPNSGGYFTGTTPLLLDTLIHCAWPVHATWGDYDRDGDLDLAAVLPVLTGSANHQVRIYQNLWIEGAGGSPFAAPIILEMPREQSPYSAAWSDFDGDGDLDLAVAGAPFRIYVNESGGFASDRFISPLEVEGFALDMAMADYDGDGNTDVAVANPFAPTALFSTLGPHLNRTMNTIATRPASSAAWGDADGEGTLDLVFGATATSVNADLYYNVFGLFPSRLRYEASGFGPHGLAYGDLNADGNLDLAFATPAEVQVYLSGNLTEPDWSVPLLGPQAVAWGDPDTDGDLDLAVGTDGNELLFLNEGGTLGSTPTLTFPWDDDTRSLAWADYDGDRYLDLATGNYEGPARVYHNNLDGTFTLAWVTPRTWRTSSLAWGDYDHDGDLDLALGNDGQANVLYENDGGVLGTQPIWTAPVVRHTSSLAWGDWNNDGDLDLAVGNAGEPDQVYLNRESRTGVPRLTWIWSSAESYDTTGVVWGDRDGDGDLDLAASTETQIGFYENQTILPAHLTDSFLPFAPLPDNPPYLEVDRPGETRNAFFHSSAEILSGPDHPTVTVEYKLFDPDGTRQGTGNAPGNWLSRTLFEFSLDGGGTWQTATPAAASPAPPTTTLRLGQAATFIWDPVADQAISDDARFRVGIVPRAVAGSSQRGITWAVSPPFRLQGTTCIWPIHAAIIASNLHPDVGESVAFVGTVEQASGVLTFLWDFGDGSSDQGQLVYHEFQGNGRYTVQLTVRSEPCPVPKELVATLIIQAGTGAANTYLPNVLKVNP